MIKFESRGFSDRKHIINDLVIHMQSINLIMDFSTQKSIIKLCKVYMAKHYIIIAADRVSIITLLI